MTFASRCLFVLACTLCLTGTAMADVTIDTAQGPVTLKAPAENVAALDIAAIDTLEALGVTPVGVPSQLYVDYLSDLAGVATRVGTLFEPDLEALANLGPDLIVIGGRSAPQLKSVSRIAPAIDMTIGGDTLVEDAFARLTALAAATGTEARAEELKSALQAKIQTARATVDGKGNGLVILTNGPKISAYGTGSRFGWIHQVVGLPEAREGLKTAIHGEAVSFEFIAEVNPDWLIVVDRGAAIGAEGDSARQTLDNALVAGTTAWKKGQVVYLDAAPVYVAGGGVQSLTHTLDEIIAAFGAAS